MLQYVRVREERDRKREKGEHEKNGCVLHTDVVIVELETEAPVKDLIITAHAGAHVLCNYSASESTFKLFFPFSSQFILGLISAGANSFLQATQGAALSGWPDCVLNYINIPAI